MKKLVAFAAFIFAAGIIISMLAIPSRAISSGNSAHPAMNASIPDSVANVLEKSCYPCHTAPGSGMALMKLDFDKWDSYSPEKQASKAGAMCKKVTKQSMPPKSFRKNNPDKVPTEADLKIICDWANSLSN